MKLLKNICLLLFISTVLLAQLERRFELEEIEFTGNEAIESDQLESVIISKESPGWFSQFLNSFTSFGGEPVYFDSLQLDNDIIQLKNFYYDNGFFKATFSASYKLDTTDNTAYLKFHINENDPAFFRKLDVTGINNFAWVAVGEVKDLIQVDTTERYSAQEVARIREQIMRLGLDFGHMLISSDTPEIKVDTLENKVDVYMNFDIGDRYRVSEVRVNKSGPGAPDVENNLIKQIADIQPEDYYSYYELQRAQVRLYRTNLFSSVLLSGVVADTNKNYVPIAINADVGLMHELSPEFIVNNEDNAFNLGVGLSFSRKNFLGDARNLTLSASTAAQDITQLITSPSLADTNVYGYIDTRLILEQPYLLGRNINTRLETYYTLQKRRNEYNATLLGGKIRFDIELPRFTYLTSLITGLNVERSKYVFSEEYTYNVLFQSTKNNFPDSSSTYIDSVVTDILSRGNADFTSEKTNSTISLDLGANKTDNLLFPTRGYSLSLLLEDGNSLSYLFNKLGGTDFNNPMYYKALFTSSFYFPVYDTKTDAFGMKFRVGTIQTYRGNKFQIPLNQRFYAGGSNSVRGWKTRELVPEQNQGSLSENPSPEEIEAVLLQNIIPGGFFILEGSIETRNRLFGDFGSAIFVDYGNVWNNYKNLQLNKIAVAAGFGFRYYSDFAPFRIDFGFKVYDPDDRRSFFKKALFKETFEFHFGIGEAF